MSHYHFHTEKVVVGNGEPKTVTCNFIVAKDYGDQEQRVAVAMGCSVKWNECWEGLCFNEGRANASR